MIDVPGDLARLQRNHLVRIVAELLANAHRHGGRGPVELTVAGLGSALLVEVDNPLPAPGDPGTVASGGHGLRRLRERVELMGGQMQAHPEGERWLASVELPILRGGPLPCEHPR